MSEDTGADETTDMPARPERPIVAVLLGLLAIAALGFTAFTTQFLYSESTQLQLQQDNGMALTLGPVHEISVGFREVIRCTTRDNVKSCTTTSLSGMFDSWDQELLVSRYMAEEPVDNELRTAIGDAELGELGKRRAAIRKAAADPNIALDMAQRELAVAKHVYNTSPTFPLIGLIAFIACLIAAVSLAIAVAVVLAGKRIRLPVMPTTTALLGVLVALGSGCLFVAFKPGPPGYVGVGVGFFVFGAGVVLGLYSSLKLNKLMRPHDLDLLEDAMKPDEF